MIVITIVYPSKYVKKLIDEITNYKKNDYAKRMKNNNTKYITKN